MQYTTRRDGSRVETALSGRLTFADASQFPNFLDQAIKGGAVCDLDLGGLTFIDSTGMSLFVHVYDAAQASGQKVIMRNARGPVADTLRRASFDTLFEFK
ncbi:MAG: anti-sigma factor antagonist [Magnetospirillum sp.]|nr:MAG: anti-sigma factor antagonist [Magnetospirillum sp.]